MGNVITRLINYVHTGIMCLYWRGRPLAGRRRYTRGRGLFADDILPFVAWLVGCLVGLYVTPPAEFFILVVPYSVLIARIIDTLGANMPCVEPKHLSARMLTRMIDLGYTPVLDEHLDITLFEAPFGVVHYDSCGYWHGTRELLNPFREEPTGEYVPGFFRRRVPRDPVEAAEQFALVRARNTFARNLIEEGLCHIE